MSCFQPLLAVDNGINPDTGKHLIKFVGLKHPEWDLKQFREFYGKNLMMLPCGHCVACAADYARTWQGRIMCEAQYHEKSCFVTLTYAKNPPDQPRKDHLREFIKNVRNKFGDGIKFFGCGEKGELHDRSHYHIILFGVDFSEDYEIISRSGCNYLGRSRTCDSLWSRGFASIGNLDIQSAGYVARYCDKKKIHGILDGEFIIMSRGLGRRYFEEHKKEIFESDYLYFNGNKFKLPRYFLKLALGDDFYTRILAEDYSARKMKVAQNFRYNHNRSIGREENGMHLMQELALDRKDKLEAVRDVV